MSSQLAELSLMELYNLGSHKGNKKSKLNPKLKSHVHSVRNNMSIIDLTKLQDSLARTEEFLADIGKRKRQVLVVGTSLQVAELAQGMADNILPEGMPFVTKRWLGGTLTNWATLRKTLKKLTKKEKIMDNDEFFNKLSRNEQLILSRETTKLQGMFGGLKRLKNNKPAAVIVLDGSGNPVAIQEAEAMNIPIITLANTGATELPSNLDYTLVCNNKSANFLKMIIERLTAAYNKGYEEGIKADTEKTDKK